MMGMSIPYIRTGRTQQKTRTRHSLISATRELLAQGLTPTVEDAAATASISRTTAYRYFPNQRALLVAAHPEIEKSSLLGPNPPEDPAARLDVLLEEFTRLTVESETELRMSLRLSLEPESSHRDDLLLRRGRAIAWIEEALTPLLGAISQQELRRLVYAIRSAVGIEALVWLTDVAGLSREDAVEVMKWSARALFRCAVIDSVNSKGHGKKGVPCNRKSPTSA